MTSDHATSSTCPVLILGAGINGICVARELVLNRVPVWIVDTHDIAFGATAKSSRLIHGGLRYLEYADFRLVAESLHERDRLLELAPQFVTPLKLHIPIRRRTGGLIAAGLRFLGLSRTRLGQWIGTGGGRGLWTVRLGLWLYDLLARSRQVPPHAVERSGRGGLSFPEDRFPWACSYYDARMECPERFCIALLQDIEKTAREQSTEFRLFTYHKARIAGDRIEIAPVRPESSPSEPTSRSLEMQPSVLINATGAWGDWTLQELPCPSPPLFGGTKGSHIFTSNSRLREALGDDAVYAEAADGRLVFLIPMSAGIMIGTTDERFESRPELAQATAPEVNYLISLTNELFPQVNLTTSDIYATCAGIRPLPSSGASRTAAISRDHQIDERQLIGRPLLTLIGGKLTTCRALGEQTADRVLKHLSMTRTANTRERVIPGAERYPKSSDLDRALSQLALTSGYPLSCCRAVWRLVGTAADQYLNEFGSPLIIGTSLPRCAVRRIIQTEWVTHLEDLVERRLLLALAPGLTRSTLEELSSLWTETRTGHRDTEAETSDVERVVQRLKTYYGRTL